MTRVSSEPGANERTAELYLDLLKRCLTRSLFPDRWRPIEPRRGSWRRALFAPLQAMLARQGLALARRAPDQPDARAHGLDWPAEAETMIGLRRLDSLQSCIADVVRRGTPGDLIETGVWRGWATIFMRAALEAYGDRGRVVWVADSFRGLPRPDACTYPADRGDRLWSFAQLAVPLAVVKANFARYGLLDERVRFLEGWFRDTLPSAPIERLAVLRIDGDLYESTMDALRSLYPKLSVGGYVIVDDYGAIPACRAAVEEYRAAHGIDEPVVQIDQAGVFWQRQR